MIGEATGTGDTTAKIAAHKPVLLTKNVLKIRTLATKMGSQIITPKQAPLDLSITPCLPDRSPPCSGAGGTPSGLTIAALVEMPAAARVVALMFPPLGSSNEPPRGPPLVVPGFAFSSSLDSSPMRMEARHGAIADHDAARA